MEQIERPMLDWLISHVESNPDDQLARVWLALFRDEIPGASLVEKPKVVGNG